MSNVNVLIFTDHPHSRLNENMNVYLLSTGVIRNYNKYILNDKCKNSSIIMASFIYDLPDV